MRSIRQIKERRKIVALSSILICIILIVSIFWMNAHAELTPVAIITVYSEKSPVNNMVSDRDNYDGSFEFTKSAKWVDYGTAEVTIGIETDALYRSDNRDVLLVVDGGYDWSSDMLSYFKTGTKRFVDDMIDYYGSKIAIVRYAKYYHNVLTEFTDDKDTLHNAIDNYNHTQYPADYDYAFDAIDLAMRNYENTTGRKVVIVFMSVFYPDWEEVYTIEGGRDTILNTYDNISFRGFQYFARSGYRNGLGMFDPTYNVTPIYYSKMLDLAASDKVSFDSIEITDFIDDTYFDIVSVDKYNYTDDELYIEDNGQNNIINFRKNDGTFKSDSSAGFKYTIKLKDEYLDKGGIYPVGKKDTIYTKIYSKEDEDVTTTETPILADNYKLYYDFNKPEGCVLDGVKESEYVTVYKTININDNPISCDGYTFKGWVLLDPDADIDIINDDYFRMPEHDVTLRAEWSKVSVNKSYTGQVTSAHANTLYEVMRSDALMDNEESTYVTNTYNGSTRIDYTKSSSNTNGKGIYMYSPTKNDEYPVYFYRGDINNNNVILGQFCWKAVITTAKGGVKLLYNGSVNTDGSCPESASNYGVMPYNYNSTPLGSEGFAYGDIQNYKVYSYETLEDMYNVSRGVTKYRYPNKSSSSISMPSVSNFAWTTTWINGRRVSLYEGNILHYYGNDISYSDNHYTINNAAIYNLYSEWNKLEGKYACSNIGDYSCAGTYVDYIFKAQDRSHVYSYGLMYGETIEDYDSKSYTFGLNIQPAGDGTYNLVDTITIPFREWWTDYENAVDKYYCLNGTTNCESPVKVTDTTDHTFVYVKDSDNILFADKVEYSNGQYKLIDPVNVFKEEEDINPYKYSCYTTSDTCEKVYYRYTQDHFIELKDGKLFSDIYPDITKNTTFSIVNGPLSGTYGALNGYLRGVHNVDVNDVLEDAIYCNDRRLSPDSSLLDDSYLGTTFMAQYRNYTHRELGPDLSCAPNDSFTVSTSNGNGALQYPVGLLTLDEFILAGGAINGGSDYNYNEKVYFDNGTNWWTMTPMNYNYSTPQLFVVSPMYHSGYWQPANFISDSFSIGVRPVVTIKNDLPLNGGKGTLEEPYTFKYE